MSGRRPRRRRRRPHRVAALAAPRPCRSRGTARATRAAGRRCVRSARAACDQRRELGAIGRRVRGDEVGERRSASSSSRSRQRSSAAKRAFSSAGPCAPALERGRDRRGIDVAHQAADVLHLPAARLVARDRCAPAAIASTQPLGQVERARVARGSSDDQRFAEVLQLVHLVLAARLRRRRGGVAGAGSSDVGGSDGQARRHERSKRRGRALCYDSRRRFARTPLAVRAPASPESVDDRPNRFLRCTSGVRSAAHRCVRRRTSASRVATADARAHRGSDPRRGPRGRRDGRGDRGLAGRRPERHACARARSRRSPTTATRASRVTVYVGQRRGHASTADFSDEAIRATVDKALAIARYTAEDPAAGLADRDRLARDWPDLDLYHPWDLDVETAIELGRETEAAALAVDQRLTNSEGATVARGESEFVYANTQRLRRRLSQLAASHRLRGDRRGRRRDAARLLVHGGARGRRPAVRRARSDASPASARRAASARAQLGTLECPVLFEAPEAADLHRRVRAARCRAAASIASRRSCSIRSARRCSRRTCTIREEPHLPRGRGSAPFDNEGVATTARDVVRDGVVQGYFLGSYSARKLGMAHDRQRRRRAQPRRRARRRRLRRRCCARMGRGLLVTEQLGQGVNP